MPPTFNIRDLVQGGKKVAEQGDAADAIKTVIVKSIP